MSKLITHIKRFALALCLATPIVSWAAEPVVVWDGDFGTSAKTGTDGKTYTLTLPSGADSWVQTDGTLKIGSGNQSAYINLQVGSNYNLAQGTKISVLMEYAGATAQTGAAPIYLQADSYFGLKTKEASLDVVGDNWSTTYPTSGNTVTTMPTDGYILMVYPQGDGNVKVYSASTQAGLTGESVGGDIGGLKFSNKYLQKIGIGGTFTDGSAKNLQNFENLVVKRVAVFVSAISTSDAASYVFPSDVATFAVDANTSVSALNEQIAGVAVNIKKVKFAVADGVTIDVDAAFSSTLPVAVESDGTVALSAAEQPDLSGVSFDVKGALLRSWLTPGVVGFNFYKNKGNDTTDALATGTWYSDANSKTGTSTALFSDGLSVLSWNCSTLYSQGGWNDQTGEEGTLLNGYMDDGSLNGNGAEVHLTNVPYETYDVIIYAASDTANASFLAKTVNNTTYTWDSAKGAVVEGNAAWGKAALNTPVYGVNTLRIKNLTGALTIYGTAKTGTPRGGISAIQIMPPETPDNIRTYKLTLDGTATNWSAGTWTLNDQPVDAPTAGYVEIVASASTEVTVDDAVSIASLTIKGAEDAVVTISTDGEEGSSFSSIGATIESGVFKQGVASCVTGLITVEDGGTFDMNGLAVGAALNIAGAGAGNWPWALTTSSGNVQLSTPPTLTADATIGGAGKITLGANGTGTDFPLGGFTLTKSGAGELYCYNIRTSNGALDIAGGTVSFNQWTALDGSETIDRQTTVTVRNGAEIKNNAGRRLWIDTFNVEAGATVTTTASGYFGVATAFNGTCDTTKLQFNDGAVVTLDGNLTVGTLVAQGDNSHTTVGAISLAIADGTDAATVTVSDTVTAVGTIAVGAGVTPAFTGEGDVTATLSYAADPSPTASTALAFTQESNWKGTVVLDYAITGANNGSVFQPGKYGNANSTVCLGKGASNIFLSVRNQSNFGDIDTKLYFKGDVSLKNGWADANQKTTIPQLGADEGVTFTTRVGGNKVTYFDITALKDFAGTIALSDYTSVTVGNVVLDELPEKGALVVKATTGTGANKGTITGSVTVGETTVPLVFGTVGEETGLMRPTSVTITVPAVANTTFAVTVGGEAAQPDTEGGNVFTVEAGSAVVVTYTGVEGYKVNNGSYSVNITATEDTTVDTSSMVVNEYVAWIYDENGDLLGNPYTAQSYAILAFSNGTGNSVRFKTALEEAYHNALIAGCSYDETTFTYTRLPTVATITSGETVYKYTSLAGAVAEAFDGAEIVLVKDVTLDARVEPNLGSGTTLTINLGGFTLTREGTTGNGSVFDVKGGTVTIKNGTIDCTQDDTAIAKDGVYAITSRSGSTVFLETLTITVDSECGACVYPFGGSTATVKSGIYSNTTTTPYRYKTEWTGMAVNQPNVADQILFLEGGTFSKVNPELGDDSGEMTNFCKAGYTTVADGDAWKVVQAPTVDGQTVKPAEVFDTATSEKGIVYPTEPTVTGEVGAQTITYMGAVVEVPAYYTATPSGNTVALTLNDNALPTVGATEAAGDDPAVPATEVTDETFGLGLTETNTKLYYGLATCDTPNGTFVDPTDLTKGTGKAMPLKANRAENETIRFYKVFVTDIAPAQ